MAQKGPFNQNFKFVDSLLDQTQFSFSLTLRKKSGIWTEAKVPMVKCSSVTLYFLYRVTDEHLTMGLWLSRNNAIFA